MVMPGGSVCSSVYLVLVMSLAVSGQYWGTGYLEQWDPALQYSWGNIGKRVNNRAFQKNYLIFYLTLGFHLKNWKRALFYASVLGRTVARAPISGFVILSLGLSQLASGEVSRVAFGFKAV